MKDSINIAQIKTAVRDFVAAREWEQFHTPKNLAAALSVEASELLEIFQWINESDSKTIMTNENKAQQIKEELSDVFYYIIRLSDVLNIDIESEFWAKLKKNADKYPIDLSKGNATKYTELKS